MDEKDHEVKGEGPDANAVRFAKPEDIKRALLTQDPIAFVTKFERDHGLRLNGIQPALELCDLIGLPRGEIYRAIKNKFQVTVLERISKLSPERSVKLLEASLDYISHPDLNEVPMSILKSFSGDLPRNIYAKLSTFPVEVLVKVPEVVRRKTWEAHLDVFDLYVDKLIEQYLNDRNVWKTSDNIALALDINARRAKTKPLMDMKKAIGLSSVLLDRVTSTVRRRFAETGDLLLCTLQADLLMVVTSEKAKSTTTIKPDVAHIVDNLKMKHSNDRTFGVVQEGSKDKDHVNRLMDIVETLVGEVIRTRDGEKAEQKQPVVIKPVAPTYVPPPQKVKGMPAKKKQKLGGGRPFGSKKSGPMTLANAVRTITQTLIDQERFAEFRIPVAEKYANNPPVVSAYLARVSNPLDLTTMQRRAERYSSIEEVLQDFDLIYSNCVIANKDTWPKLVQEARHLKTQATKFLEDNRRNIILPEDDDNQEDKEKKADDAEHSNMVDDGGMDVEPFEDSEEELEPDHPPLPPGPPPTIKIKLATSAALSKPSVTSKAADAVMVLADPNTHHSLAKMFWDVINVEIAPTKTMPRDLPAVCNLVWLMRLGEEAKAIVENFVKKQAYPLLTEGPPTKNKLDVYLHRIVPLLSLTFVQRVQPDFHVLPQVVEYCKSHVLARELLLRLACLLVRMGDERVALEVLKVGTQFASHPGFRRGLAHVLKDANGLVLVRKFAFENVFLPHIQALRETQNESKELAEAHEFLALVLGSKTTLKLFIETEPQALLEYAQQALKGILPSFYLSPLFKGPRQHYEQFFADESFSAYRISLGIPVVPVGANKDLSPGSTKPSPSPGSFRPQSASPGASVGGGGRSQSASPSFYSSPGAM